jgi:quinol monooxygenase YgiN
MGATVHVVARFVAKAGKEEALKTVLTSLIAPTRREVDCYQYDLLINPADPRDLCFVERWGSDKALDQHGESAHLKKATEEFASLVEAPPDIRRYRIV